MLRGVVPRILFCLYSSAFEKGSRSRVRVGVVNTQDSRRQGCITFATRLTVEIMAMTSYNLRCWGHNIVAVDVYDVHEHGVSAQIRKFLEMGKSR